MLPESEHELCVVDSLDSEHMGLSDEPFYKSQPLPGGRSLGIALGHHDVTSSALRGREKEKALTFKKGFQVNFHQQSNMMPL